MHQSAMPVFFVRSQMPNHSVKQGIAEAFVPVDGRQLRPQVGPVGKRGEYLPTVTCHRLRVGFSRGLLRLAWSAGQRWTRLTSSR